MLRHYLIESLAFDEGEERALSAGLSVISFVISFGSPVIFTGAMAAAKSACIVAQSLDKVSSSRIESHSLFFMRKFEYCSYFSVYQKKPPPFFKDVC